ncbi:hypothetical protein NKG94_22785 [Micromonospora sp. M12]
MTKVVAAPPALMLSYTEASHVAHAAESGRGLVTPACSRSTMGTQGIILHRSRVSTAKPGNDRFRLEPSAWHPDLPQAAHDERSRLERCDART